MAERPDDLAELAGPLLLGYMFNWGLFGILTVQVYIYHQAFKDDFKYVRSLVYTIYVLEFAQTMIATNDAFNTYARRFGDYDVLVLIQLIWLSIPVMTGIISMLVQIYYAYRLYVLSRSKTLGIVIIIMSLFQGVSAIVGGVQAEKAKIFTELEVKARVATTAWHVGSAVCDVTITLFMTFYLFRRDTGMDNTHELINKLIRLIVETGTVNAAMSLIDIILFLSQPKKLYFMCTALILTKMYSNSLLVLFNSRVRFSTRKDMHVHSSSVSGQTSFVTFARSRRVMSTIDDRNLRLPRPITAAVHIHEETWNDNDSIPMSSISHSKSKFEGSDTNAL